MRRILEKDFYFKEHFKEHQKYLKIEGCRVTDAELDGPIELTYKTNGAKWIVRYGTDGPGDIDIYFHVPAMDNLKALKELLKRETKGL